MIIIYDFDRTLTPYSLPLYEILKRIGYDDEELMNLVRKRWTMREILYTYPILKLFKK